MKQKAKRPNRQDLTLVNLRAMKKRLDKIEARIKKIELAHRRR